VSLVPGLVSVTFRRLTPAEIVALAAANGMAAIEWGGDVHVPVGAHGVARQVAARCGDAGIAVEAYGSYYRAGGDGFEPVLATALSLGAPRIRVWAGDGTAGHAAVAADLRRIAALAAGEGVEIAVEYHADTLTGTLTSALALFAAAPGVRSYWQPPVGSTLADALAAVPALDPVAAHVFTWDATGNRLPLAEGAALWRPVLAALGELPGDRHVLLEFVRDDEPNAFVADASTLRGWLSRPG
jgi:sugar phosphate isomerase/epimerase